MAHCSDTEILKYVDRLHCVCYDCVCSCILSHSFYMDDNQHGSDCSFDHYNWDHCCDNVMHNYI